MQVTWGKALRNRPGGGLANVHTPGISAELRGPSQPTTFELMSAHNAAKELTLDEVKSMLGNDVPNAMTEWEPTHNFIVWRLSTMCPSNGELVVSVSLNAVQRRLEPSHHHDGTR